MMKQFVFYFILHIGFALAVFNPCAAAAEEYASRADAIIYEVKNFAPDEVQTTPKKKPLVHSDNQLAKLYFVFRLIDELYPNEKINQNFTGILSKIYPEISEDNLQTMQRWFQSLISVKRRYVYVVNALEKKVKALAMLPKDAPIVAEDGEYAKDNPEQRKLTPEGEYGINYQPYKYLEYDKGESGDPVRRRDKNYIERVDISDEVTLALLKFDIPAIYKALRKVPRYSDGSGEKTNTLSNGVQTRLLLDVSHPGDAETIRGVIDVYVPKGYYINGDMLNTAARPRFFLSEDKAQNHNIKSYQLFHPAPGGVVQKGQNIRVFTQNIRFPIEFKRIDTEKGIKITGDFQFELCNKNNFCQPMHTEHELTLKPSERHEFSIYNNYVTQAFAHLPRESSPHASIKEVQYIPQQGKLRIHFDVSRKFSNVAVMAEDGSGTNYINPRYAISDNEIIAEFDAPADISPQKTAITAIFNDYESLRKITVPAVFSAADDNRGFPHAGKTTAFIFGLFLNLMPGIMYLFIRLTGFLWQRQHYIRIFLRYAFGSALGFAVIAVMYHKRYFSEMYTNVWLMGVAGMVAVSFLMEGLGYMDFALFRPLGGKVRRGWLCGIFSALFIAALPVYLAPEVLSRTFSAPLSQALPLWISIWCGLLFLPLLMLIFRRQGSFFLAAMQRFNVFYNILFIIAILLLLYMSRGIYAAFIAAALLALTAGLWYIYPMLIEEAAKHARSIKRKGEIFNKVQHCALAAVVVIYLLLAGSISLFKLPLSQPAPTPEQTSRIAAAENSRGVPVLVMITADWSITSLINRKEIHWLADSGIKVIHIPTGFEATNVTPWFLTYGKDYAPLNILFTYRHPRGLVIPDKLQQLNWLAALTELEERKPAHD